jgi:hypothetical protein
VLSLVDCAAAGVTAPGPPALEQLACCADLVVLGKVTRVTAAWNAAHTNILTRIELDVAEVFRGRVEAPLAFTQLGGQVGDEISVIGGAARFQPGERVVVFLTRRDGELRLADPILGKLTVARDRASGRDTVLVPGTSPTAQLDLDQVRTEIRRARTGAD